MNFLCIGIFISLVILKMVQLDNKTGQLLNGNRFDIKLMDMASSQ